MSKADISRTFEKAPKEMQRQSKYIQIFFSLYDFEKYLITDQQAGFG